MADLEQRVAAGAALLDRERPGWWEEVDTERLDMASECDCVLGQVWGEYIDGVNALHVRGDGGWVVWSTDHGFERADWTDLDRLWLAAIAERRARAESVGPTADPRPVTYAKCSGSGDCEFPTCDCPRRPGGVGPTPEEWAAQR